MTPPSPPSQQQLLLFPDQPSPPSGAVTSDMTTDRPASASVSSLNGDARPTHTGRSTVEYATSRSILTPGSGFAKAYKFTLNPYGGCSFGCEYCYARFFAPTVDEQNSWGEWVRVKQNALELIRRAKCTRSPHRRLDEESTIYMSSVTDPYQPVEQSLQLTRAILEELVSIQPRLTVQTRSPLVTRDIDLLKRFRRIRVNMTITTDSERVRLRYEPHCPAINVRFQALEKLKHAEIPIGVSISPMLPLDDVESFGRRIAEVHAQEYVTQYLKPLRSRFTAGSTRDVIDRLLEDGWTEERYREARAVLVRILGSEHPLLEGSRGYAPA
jgi:DNA repair photolyase